MAPWRTADVPGAHMPTAARDTLSVCSNREYLRQDAMVPRWSLDHPSTWVMDGSADERHIMPVPWHDMVFVQL